MEEKFIEGVIVGIDEESDELLISTAQGIIPARSVRRRDPGSQWCAPAILNLEITPSDYYQLKSGGRHIPSINTDPMIPTPAADAQADFGLTPRAFRTNPTDSKRLGVFRIG